MSNRTRLNIGTVDRVLRAVLGLIALAFVFTGPRTSWGYLGLIPLLTAAIGYCPLYAALGFSTRSERHVKHQAPGAPRFHDKPVDLVVDVRSKVEFWGGHLPRAVCIPVEQLPRGLARRAGISTASRILVYCASDNCSAAAASQLRAAGYTNVVDGGGMSAAWKAYAP